MHKAYKCPNKVYFEEKGNRINMEPLKNLKL